MGVALAACSASPAPSPSFTAAVVQQRGDITAGRVQLRVTNTSGSPETFTTAALLSPALREPAEWDARRPVTLDPGHTVDLPIVLPAVRCTDDPGDAQATFTVDGLSVSVPPDDALDVLGRAGATACDQEDMASVARIRAAGASAGVDGTIALRVDVAPSGVGTGTVELVALRGTVLLRFADGAEAPLHIAVSARDRPSHIDVAVVPQRCDAHAIAEDKVGTLFDLVVRIDGREVAIPLERSQEVADTLLALTARVCGLTPAG